MNRLEIALVPLLVVAILVMPGISSSSPHVRSLAQQPPGGTPFFQDNFTGTSIDSAKWNSSYQTSGLRWCPSTIANHLDVPGTWLDPSTTSCQGITQAPPYGTVSVSGGAATIGSLSSRAAPYIWSGPPSKESPFPATGNFVLEVKMHFDVINGDGDGLFVTSWTNTNPAGNNPPGGQQRVFQIFAGGGALGVQLLGQQSTALPDPLGTHDYVLGYVNGVYTVTVDGVLTLGPLASTSRANTIWLGNPVFMYWTIGDWSTFSLNSVQVNVPVPSIQLTPSQGPVGTRITVTGFNFPSSTVIVNFDDLFLGNTQISNGTFTFVLDVPDAQPGIHQIKAGLLEGSLASATFRVTPTIAAAVSVGAVYFPGDQVVVDILVSAGGSPLVSPMPQLDLNVTRPDNSNLALTTTPVGPGHFRATYLLSNTAAIGTYSLTAVAHVLGQGNATALASFEVKLSWLSSRGSTIAMVGIAATAVIGIALVSWRKGYFGKSSNEE